jgi:hypothetical protein
MYGCGNTNEWQIPYSVSQFPHLQVHVRSSPAWQLSSVGQTMYLSKCHYVICNLSYCVTCYSSYNACYLCWFFMFMWKDFLNFHNSGIKKTKKQNKLHGLSLQTNYSDRRFSAKWLPTFADKGCHVVIVTDPYGRILGFLDRSRYFSIK